MADERFDVDRSTEQAWTNFRLTLADFLADLSAGEVAQIGLGGLGDCEAEAAPYVTFVASGDGKKLLAVLVDPRTVSPPVALSAEQESALRAAGWYMAGGDPGDAGPGDTALIRVTKDRRFADELAVLGTDALRDVFGVVHPSFLVGGPIAEVEEAAPAPTFALPTLDPLTAYLPGDFDELNDQVSAALTPLFGHVPVRDEDGDIAISDGRFWLYVRVSPVAPVIQVFGPVLNEVRDTAFAQIEVSILNRDSALVQYFCADDDSIQAMARIPAAPFVPHHLLTLIESMLAKVNEVHADLELRVGSSTCVFASRPVDVADEPQELDDDDEADGGPHVRGASQHDLPQELMTLINLGSADLVDPALVAQIFHHDPVLLLDAIRIATEEWLEWRDCAVAAAGLEDAEEATACATEFLGWKQTEADLRRGLRAVYTANAQADHRRPPEQLSECRGPAA